MSTHLLAETLQQELPRLLALDDERTSKRVNGPASWSAKEELGHLIDSAANNHVRFVRGALDGAYTGPGYAQNEWVDLHSYRDMQWKEIISLWYQYNLLLARVIERIPEARLEATMKIGSEAPVTLRFVIEDYISHMRQHLQHLLPVT